MKKYVVGLLFVKQYIVLVEKNHPQWQAGLLNGIGGEIKPDELSLQAMQREFKEETGVLIKDWYQLAHIIGYDFKVDVYMHRDNHFNLKRIPGLNDVGEKLKIIERFDVPYCEHVPDLPSLIALASLKEYMINQKCEDMIVGISYDRRY